MKGKLIIFSAPSGSGKTTIIKELLTENYKIEFSISACSRKKRDGEEHGKDYYFLSVEEFKSKIKQDDFLEWEEVYKDNYYGTLKNEVQRIRNLGHNVLFDVDVVGGINIKNFYKDEALSIFIKPPSIEELKNRLTNRSTDDEESINKRIEKAEFELSFANKFDEVVINDNLKTAIIEVKSILNNFLKN